MRKRMQIKYIHEGDYVAEVDVNLVEAEGDWAPYLSLEDAYRLDDVRAALRRGDLKTAAHNARIFTKQPVAISG